MCFQPNNPPPFSAGPNKAPIDIPDFDGGGVLETIPSTVIVTGNKNALGFLAITTGNKTPEAESQISTGNELDTLDHQGIEAGGSIATLPIKGLKNLEPCLS